MKTEKPNKENDKIYDLLKGRKMKGRDEGGEGGAYWLEIIN